jgi:hypothetical protein
MLFYRGPLYCAQGSGINGESRAVTSHIGGEIGRDHRADRKLLEYIHP